MKSFIVLLFIVGLASSVRIPRSLSVIALKNNMQLTFDEELQQTDITQDSNQTMPRNDSSDFFVDSFVKDETQDQIAYSLDQSKLISNDSYRNIGNLNNLTGDALKYDTFLRQKFMSAKWILINLSEKIVSGKYTKLIYQNPISLIYYEFIINSKSWNNTQQLTSMRILSNLNVGNAENQLLVNQLTLNEINKPKLSAANTTMNSTKLSQTLNNSIKSKVEEMLKNLTQKAPVTLNSISTQNLILTNSTSVASSNSSLRTSTGGYLPKNINNLTDFQKRLDIELRRNYMSNDWVLNKLEQQVVSGFNYKFTYTSPNGNQTYQFIIYSQPWTNKLELKSLIKTQNKVSTQNLNSTNNSSTIVGGSANANTKGFTQISDLKNLSRELKAQDEYLRSRFMSPYWRLVSIKSQEGSGINYIFTYDWLGGLETYQFTISSQSWVQANKAISIKVTQNENLNVIPSNNNQVNIRRN